ncbi:ribosome maturation protein SBDS [Anastrepha obliqua]|uniref:ribosome maturation protein SBDS n=1 Tax=Anastrepha ludens TaxID=28586 RepID=UPI0023AF898C|nr:ribosome maturation protein SBDS [Anastrepha ludens]XP_054733412.1 ribosome maturation protein SBDS [Anastrepha obliqua]
MSKIFTPTNQIRLTNVAVVRLKKGGKRFEIACYKNKVLSWRNNTEKDIDEVLQTHTVFINVSKGQAAKKDELLKAFGKSDETEVCKEILAKGELQVSEKERQSVLESQLNSIINSVAASCVNPETRRPYPATIIEKSLKDAHFSVKMNKNTKQQTLDAIKLLREHIPIERSRMKLRVSFVGKECGNRLKESVSKLATKVEHEEWDEAMLHMTLLIDPGNYRVIDELIRNETKGKGLVELLELKEVVENEEIF